MRLASRLRASQFASAAGLFSAVLLLAPPPALADRDDWEDDDRHRGRHHHRRHYDHDDHHGHKKHHRHHHGHGARYARPYVYYDAPVYYGPPPRAHRSRYYCEPCSHWYHDEPAFHRHVHHHHHVPRAVIPLVLMATVFGAVFGGY